MKILHILSGLDGGGAGKIAYDYSLNIFPKADFDFVVITHSEGIREKELEEKGFHVFRVKQMRESLIGHYRQLKEIMKTGKYDIVHVHWGYKSIFALLAAKNVGIPVRIAHSHVAFEPESLINKMERMVTTPIVKATSTCLFACGQDASVWTWGKDKGKKENPYIMTNAIEVDKYCFSETIRTEIRNELQIEDKFVIGNIARFTYQKNNLYLIDIFYEIKKKNPQAVLMLIGRGELEKEIRERVNKYGLQKDVLFLGIKKDAYRYYNAMDIFMLPSRYEGLPVVLVECQANGLPAYVSDSVTSEIKLSDNVHYLDISESPKFWAEKIIKENNSRYSNVICNTKYDITVASEKLFEKYNTLLCGKKK